MSGSTSRQQVKATRGLGKPEGPGASKSREAIHSGDGGCSDTCKDGEGKGCSGICALKIEYRCVE